MNAFTSLNDITSLFTLSNVPAFFLSYVLFDFSLLFSNCELFAFDLEMQEK